MSITTNQMILTEVLDFISKNPESLGTEFQYSPNSPLDQIFKANFIEEAHWMLPEGDPPYTPYTGRNGTAPTDLIVAIRRDRLSYFSAKKNILPIKREEIFIKLLEGVHASEAKILLAIKDQKLESLYPTITYDLLAEYGYLPKREVQDVEESKSNETNATEDAKETAVVETKPVEKTTKRGRAKAKPTEK